jgi:hypothetical protein
MSGFKLSPEEQEDLVQACRDVHAAIMRLGVTTTADTPQAQKDLDAALIEVTRRFNLTETGKQVKAILDAAEERVKRIRREVDEEWTPFGGISGLEAEEDLKHAKRMRDNYFHETIVYLYGLAKSSIE